MIWARYLLAMASALGFYAAFKTTGFQPFLFCAFISCVLSYHLAKEGA